MLGTALIGLLSTGIGTAVADNGHDADKDTPHTRTPIKHLIYIIGENRSFDNVFGVYQPRNGQRIANLLSAGIVNLDGSPGANFSKGMQFQVTTPAAAGSTFTISPADKVPYTVLPVPTTLNAFPLGVGLLFGIVNAQGIPTANFPQGDPEIPLADQITLATGGTGLPTNKTDTSVNNFNNLPPGPFPQDGPKLPYDSYEGDTIHQMMQMWQQSDCSVANATRDNPTGCLHDLYPFVATSNGTLPGKTSTDGSQDMAFYNMSAGDAPIFKALADTFAISDNFHQSAMGGSVTAALEIGYGDNPFFSDGNGNVATPTGSIDDPDPVTGSFNTYIANGTWIKCGDRTQPGVAAIADYLASLSYTVTPNCAPGAYYPIRDADLPFSPTGGLLTNADAARLPPVTQRHIGDALNEKNISWVWYGGGYSAAVNVTNGATDAQDQVFALGYCGICNPFQYSKSIMGDPAQIAAHLQDMPAFFSALQNGTLPAVSFVKMDGGLEGHPGSGKLDLLEDFVQNVVTMAQGSPEFGSTAIVFTVDESGGLYDSGFIQPLDFFGDGPRIPLIVVSPFSTGGKVSHAYADQASVLKFIERNWELDPLTERSRDNLPNPHADDDNPYVPRNMPAISDLFDMFDFDQDRDRAQDDRDHGDRDQDRN